MNRRNVLSLSAITAFGLALLPGNAFAQSAADMEGVKAASKAFYAALMVIDDGAAMDKVWAHTDYVTNTSPREKTIVVGWDAIKKYWPQTNGATASRTVSLSEQHIHVNGNLGWEMGVEVGQIALKDGRTIEINALVGTQGVTKKPLDTIPGVIWSGFILWFILTVIILLVFRG